MEVVRLSLRVFVLMRIFSAAFPTKCCSLTSQNISYVCEAINTVTGYSLSVPGSVPSECLKECEHGWYNKNNTLMVDSKEPREEAIPRNLTTTTCLDEAYWRMDCHCSGKANFEVSYRGISGIALHWMESYLSGRSFKVSWRGKCLNPSNSQLGLLTLKSRP
ncbi:uncharacterized protein LOC117599236 isoform X1 [Tachysurus ichikawai]